MIPLLLAVLLLGAAVPAASAQTLHGTVRDQDTRAPVPGATVELMTGAGNVVATERSDSAGNFVVRASGPGLFLVRVSSEGYLSSPGQFVQLDAGAETRIDIHLLSRPPFELDPIEVSVERIRLRLAGKGFYERRDRGHGYFVTPEDLEERPPVTEAEVIIRAPFVHAEYGRGGTRIRMGSSCQPLIFVDDFPANSPILEENVFVEEIVAVEVYRGYAEIPQELALGLDPCGVVMIWTERSVGGGLPF